MVNRDQPAASLAPAPPVVGVLQGAAAAAARLGQVQWTQGLVYVRIDRPAAVSTQTRAAPRHYRSAPAPPHPLYRAHSAMCLDPQSYQKIIPS